VQGAGGVGGLLAVTEHGETADTPYYTTYDANGNISEYLDNTGSVAVHYEYSPFGRLTLVESETGAPDFNHRFSTKFFDSETRLYYYGFRYYSNELGRWLSRDPIGEEGGLNVYKSLNNAPLNYWDYLGREPNDRGDAANNQIQWVCSGPVCRICYSQKHSCVNKCGQYSGTAQTYEDAMDATEQNALNDLSGCDDCCKDIGVMSALMCSARYVSN